MCELPGCSPPLEVVVVFAVREAVLGALNVHLVVRAIHLLLEGQGVGAFGGLVLALFCVVVVGNILCSPFL